MRLIDADEYPCNKCGVEYCYQNCKEFRDWFNTSVDAEPVRHGKWGECFEDWRKQFAGDKCSACGFEHYGSSITHYNYCPNCGARMDGD